MVKLGSKLNFVFFFFYSSLGSRPSARRPPLLSVAPTRHCAAGQRRGASRPPGHMAAPAPRSPITLPQSHRSFLLLLRRDVQECAGGHHCRPSGKLVPRLPQTQGRIQTPGHPGHGPGFGPNFSCILSIFSYIFSCIF